jgi:hypothetical protein
VTTQQRKRLIPIYTTPGDLGAFMVYPFLFNSYGEWIGFVQPNKDVYSVLGYYVGYLADGPRILRKRSYSFDKPRVDAPTIPGKIKVPATVPLPPMMSEISLSIVDVLDEEPEKLSTIDFDGMRQDMD